MTFGTLVAAGLPIVTALFGLGVSSAGVGLLAAVMDVPDWSTAVASMIGLGVGIDYALLILTRHRSALAAGKTPREAVVEAVSTAGHSVLVAGTTVVISLLGLFLMGLSYLQGVALSASFAVLVTMAASVTLLPALLGFAGRKIDRLRIPGADRPPQRPRRTRRPRAGAAPCSAGRGRPRSPAPRCCSCSPTPFLGLRLGFPDAGNDRAATMTRQAYDLVDAGLRRGRQRPAAARGGARATPATAPQLGALAARAARASRASRPSAQPAINPAGDTAVLTVVPDDVAAVARDRGPHPPTCAPTCSRAPGCRSASAGRPRRSSTRATSPPTACRCSSAAS